MRPSRPSSTPSRLVDRGLTLTLGCLLWAGCSGGGGGGGAGRSSVAPTLTALSPTSGPSQGGGIVTLNGSGLSASGLEVFFGGIAATSISAVSDSSLSCVAPGGSGTVDVRVQGSNGESALLGAYSYGAAPIVGTVTPDHASAFGALPVVISGSNFGSSLSSVTFGGVPATITSVADDEVQCTLPTGTPGAIVDIRVTSVDGSGTAAGAFRYHAAPQITSVQPSSAFDGGAFEVHGFGFEADDAGPSAVLVGSQPASPVDRVSDQQLIATVPGGLSHAPQNVTVSNDNGFVTANAALTPFTFPPVIQDTDSRLDGSQTSVSTPRVAVNDNEVYVAWLDANTGQFRTYFRRSVDHGTTWGPVTQLSTSSNPCTGRIQLANDGSNVVVVWVEDPAGGNNNEIYARRSSDGGATWPTPPARIDTVPNQSSNFVDLYAAGPALFVAWEQGFHAAVAYSPDGGVSWSNPTELSANSATDLATFATDDAVYVAYAYRPTTSTPWEIRVHTAARSGTSISGFSSATALSRSGREARGPAFVETRSGDVLVVFEEAGAGQSSVSLNRTSDDGATWLPMPVDIRMGVGDVQNLSAIAVGDALCVVWNNFAFTELAMSRSTDDGQSWVEVTAPLSTGSGAANQPQLSASGDTLLLGFNCTRYGYDDPLINVSLDAGETWLSQDIRLDDDFRFSGGAHFTLEGARVHAVWVDNRSVTQNHLYYNRTRPF